VTAPTAKQLAELAAAVATLRAEEAKTSSASYIPHKPHPKQAEFLALTTREALYGGAAGGGKSDALLMAALQYVHVPGYSALILRRTFRDLNQPDAIMARSHAWLRSTAAKWNDRDKRWTFPSGASLTFGYLDSEADMFQYQGAALQLIAFDELTQFPERPYRYLFSRLRRLQGVDVPLRMRAATNPGGIGHEWVRRRFIADQTGERPFVPALLVDNPSLDAEEYRSSLANLDATTRQQLEHGVWVRDSGGLVYEFIDMNLGTVPKLTHHLIGIDYGFTDATAFCVVGWRENDPTVYVVECYKRTGLTPSEAAEEAALISAKYQPVKMVADIGGLGKGYAEEARRRFSLPIEPAEKQNKRGYIDLMNGDLRRARIVVDAGKCPELLAEWAELPWDEARAKEAPGFENHCSDAALYAWRAANAFGEREPDEREVTQLERLRAEERALEEQLEGEAQAEQTASWWET
jgi:hypothetical protein